MARRYARKTTKDDQLGYVILAGVVVALILLGGLVFLLKSNQIPIDLTTLCPKTLPYPHTVVLVDKTDPLSPGHTRLFEAAMAQFQETMVQNERLSIFVLTDTNYSQPEPVFSLCKPADGEDTNDLYENPRKIRATFETQFGTPLQEVTASLLVGDERPQSPIIEMIFEVAQLPDFRANGLPRRLILFSDMLQNVPDYSHYSTGIPDFDAMVATPYASRLPSSLSIGSDARMLEGVQVDIFYLVRPSTEALQVRGHVLFWEKFFSWLGARVQTVRPIQ